MGRISLRKEILNRPLDPSAMLRAGFYSLGVTACHFERSGVEKSIGISFVPYFVSKTNRGL